MPAKKATKKQKTYWNGLFRFIFDYIAQRSINTPTPTLTQIDWAEFKEFAAYHEFGPFAWAALKEYSSLIPKNIYSLLRNTYYYHLVRNQYLLREFLNVSAIFKENGIEFIPIKGIALLEDIYRQYPVRPMVDIDVLVKEERVSKAKEIFNSLGYRQELRGCKEEYWRKSQIHLAFISPRKYKGMNLSIELHWGIDFKRKNRVILPEIWERTREIAATTGEEISLLSPEDTLFALSLHSRRFGEAFCLKNVFDAGLLLSKYSDKFDWRYCLHMCDKYELNSALFFMLYRVSYFCKVNIPEYVREKLKVSSFKKVFIKKVIQEKTFSRGLESQTKKLYLITHFLLYDTFWQPIRYILNIPLEQFAKYYGLKPYEKKTKKLHRLRFFYIPFHAVLELFWKDKKSERFLKEEKNRSNLFLVRGWGQSMYPNILDGDILIYRKAFNIKKGDVIFYKNNYGQNVIHRVIKADKSVIVTKGDNIFRPDKPTTHKDIIGKVIVVKRGDRVFPIRGEVLYGKLYMLSFLIIFLREKIKTVILFLQKNKFYPELARVLFRNLKIDFEGPIEAENFYCLRANFRKRTAGIVKIGKKNLKIISLYVPVLFKGAGIEQLLIKKSKNFISKKKFSENNKDLSR